MENDILCQDKPLVSVIVPVYNGERFLADALKSVLFQTYKNIELIIVDDASTDNSRHIIESFADDRIQKVYLEKNNNICYASNYVFSRAQGKYIALIGHDDIWKEDKLEKQVAFMEANPSYGLCFSWVDIIDENNHIINDKEAFLYNRFHSENLESRQWIYKVIMEGNYFCAPSACIRRDCLEKAGYYRYGLVQLQDYDLWLRVMRITSVHIVMEKLVQYRRCTGETNLSHVNMKTQNRHAHEEQWILDSFIEQLRPEEFIDIFGDVRKNKNACTEKEIQCEKAFFFAKLNKSQYVKRFIELLEDEECRNILEKQYNFRLNDFYEMNTKSILFDRELAFVIQDQNQKLQKQNEVIQMQNRLIQEQDRMLQQYEAILKQ